MYSAEIKDNSANKGSMSNHGVKDIFSNTLNTLAMMFQSMGSNESTSPQRDGYP